ncbi:helix-turn-helix domain-containing protein [Halocatena pleomorpha]|uniref:Conditioned medium-induced protein 4 n=1 Tax=Halocatena pleomorpha TaxID=1785090 RepID=A0A3P3RAE7_9EURY|nr:hypothetical protein [Halocatena pleomorpha]RRJ30355.1 hypothetical protein EIK79_10580 [Halocatena pleomorpha]
MNEKTAELRDIFIDVTDDDTITEEQAETRGSLTEDDREIRTKLRDAIGRMSDRLTFETDLSVDTYETIVRGFYDGAGDTALADRIDRDRETVVRARSDLHLLRDQETDVAFDTDAFRRLLTEGHTDEEIADRLDVTAATVADYRRVVEIEDERRRVNSRYTDEFEELLTDADLRERTEDVTETGLDEATEGMETDVSM